MWNRMQNLNLELLRNERYARAKSSFSWQAELAKPNDYVAKPNDYVTEKAGKKETKKISFE